MWCCGLIFKFPFFNNVLAINFLIWGNSNPRGGQNRGLHFCLLCVQCFEALGLVSVAHREAEQAREKLPGWAPGHGWDVGVETASYTL